MIYLNSLAGKVDSFLSTDNRGAASIQFVVLTAAVVGIAASVIIAIEPGLKSSAEGILGGFSLSNTHILNANNLGAENLTAAEKAIASRVQAMVQEEFPDIPPDEMKYLLASQLAAMTSAWWFGQIPAASRNMLSTAQIQAIPPAIIAPNAGKLTALQIDAMTKNQFSEVRSGYVIVNMLKKQPSVLPNITATQIASVQHPWWFGQLVTTTDGNLSQTQIQAALPSAIAGSVGKLTAEQIGWLSSAQVSKVEGGYPLVSMLIKSPGKISQITPAQIGTIQHPWWFGQLVTTTDGKLSQTQIQAALPSAIAGSVGKLTTQQIGWLSSAQMNKVEGSYPLVSMLIKSPGTISQLTPAQIGTIQHPWWLGQIPVPVLQDMTQAQVGAIPADIYPNIKSRFTADQQAWRP